MKDLRQQWLETVRDFIGLWDRFGTLYLDGFPPDEVTDEREDEFLAFEGTMVERLVRVVEFERDRFDLESQVMAVIHDAPSLRWLSRQSDFQQRRLRQRWAEAGESLTKLSNFCETYSPKFDKTTRLEEVRRINPFWNPAEGGFQATLMKLVSGPVTFFAGLRPSPQDKANWFLFKVLIVPTLIVFLALAIIHLKTVQQMAFNFGETSGILPDREGFAPKLIAHLFALLGVLILGLVTTAVLMLLALLHTGTLHAAFKLFGAKGDMRTTHRIVAYGSGAFVTIITAPYTLILEMIGAHKAHKVPPGLAPFAWIIGTALLVVIVLGVMFAAYYFTDQIPQAGEYVEVTGIGAKLYKPISASSVIVGDSAETGARYTYKGRATKAVSKDQRLEFLQVDDHGDERYLRTDAGVVKEFKTNQIPIFVLELTWNKLMFVVRRLSGELGAEAD